MVQEIGIEPSASDSDYVREMLLETGFIDEEDMKEAHKKEETYVTEVPEIVASSTLLPAVLELAKDKVEDEDKSDLMEEYDIDEREAEIIINGKWEELDSNEIKEVLLGIRDSFSG